MPASDNGPVMVDGRPNPTGTGRYCPPRLCWCGGCAWWTPNPAPDYTRLIAAAEKATAKQRRTWAARAEPTWIDQL